MDKEKISDGLTEILRDALNDDDLVVTPQMSAKDHAEWDSFNHINIIVAAEAKFGIKFNTTEVDGLRNVGDFISLIERKTNKAA
jgi:acyl carrier protein